MNTCHKRNRKPADSYAARQEQEAFLYFCETVPSWTLQWKLNLCSQQGCKKRNPCHSIKLVPKELQVHMDNGGHHSIPDCWEGHGVECVNRYMPAVEGRKEGAWEKLHVCIFWIPKFEQISNFNGLNTLQNYRAIKMPPNQSMKAKCRTMH